MIINSRILLLKLGLQINAANYSKYQRRPLVSLATIMFRGTPCTFYIDICKEYSAERQPTEFAGVLHQFIPP